MNRHRRCSEDCASADLCPDNRVGGGFSGIDSPVSEASTSAVSDGVRASVAASNLDLSRIGRAPCQGGRSLCLTQSIKVIVIVPVELVDHRRCQNGTRSEERLGSIEVEDLQPISPHSE